MTTQTSTTATTATSQSAQAFTQGAHHVGLTVPNLAQARDFFIDVLGYQQVGGKPEYPAVFVSDGSIMITLWQAENPEAVTSFDRRNNIGLHHLALGVSDVERLHELNHRLSDEESVTVEFAPEPLGGGPTQHMMCAIPGGIRVEFIAKG
ncbi:MAG: VOC family protein [Porticoccaceae bacterium]|nr:VOC family protein [Porticoccaceae bacterium]